MCVKTNQAKQQTFFRFWWQLVGEFFKLCHKESIHVVRVWIKPTRQVHRRMESSISKSKRKNRELKK